jgi:hypothetical protein
MITRKHRFGLCFITAAAAALSAAPLASAAPARITPTLRVPFIHNIDLLQPNQAYLKYWDLLDLDSSQLDGFNNLISSANSTLAQIPYVNGSIAASAGMHLNGDAVVLPTGNGNGTASIEARANFDAGFNGKYLTQSFSVSTAPSIDAWASYTRTAGNGTYKGFVVAHDFTGAILHYLDTTTPDPLSFNQSFQYSAPSTLPGTGNVTISGIPFSSYNTLLASLSATVTGSFNVVGGGSLNVDAKTHALVELTGSATLLAGTPAQQNLSAFAMFSAFQGPWLPWFIPTDAEAKASAGISAAGNGSTGAICGSASASIFARQIGGYDVSASGGVFGNVGTSNMGIEEQPSYQYPNADEGSGCVTF